MLTPEGIQALGCWVGHPAHALQRETGLTDGDSPPAAIGLDAGALGCPSFKQQHADEGHTPAGKHRSLGPLSSNCEV